MDSASDAPPEERSTDEPSSFSEAIPNDALLPPNAETPAIVGSPEVFYPHEQLDWNVGAEMDNLQANMVIDLARIQGESNHSMIPPIDEFEDVLVRLASPPPTEQQAQGDAAEQSMARSTRSSTRSTPGSTPKRKKRKRTVTPAKASTPPARKQEDDDDGLICSICFAEWTMTGDHRVVSLKCGHLFGMSCIKRWLQDNPVASRSCATCKAKAKLTDIRFIYGRAVKAIDNTREVELTQELESEKTISHQLKLKLHVMSQQLSEVQMQLAQCERRLEEMKQTGMGQESQQRLLHYNYMLMMEKNVLIGQEAGCRAMVWANNHKMLLISQKSTQPLFPGYAIRLLQLPSISGRATQTVIHVGTKCVRDIALDVTDNLFTCATMERTVKFYSLVTRTLQFSISLDQESIIWACAFDRVRPYIVYLGTQRGMVYVYDIRETTNFLHVFPVGHILGDQTAVIKICPVEVTATIPYGGFLVCKLKSIWFYDYKTAEGVDDVGFNPLNISGTFSSMSYNPDSGMLLIGIRPMPNVPSTLVLGTLVAKAVPGTDVFSLQILHKFEGSRVQTVMQRCAQVLLNNTDTLVVAYLEDSKTLATWCTNKGSTYMQQLPLTETVLDICSISGPHGETYLVTLSYNRCRIFKVITDRLNN
uniref:RING-type E3 ubiquitin transferase n=1 Tax=Anopheles atroparvus TaxID=41427 RepID=A0AAG5DHS6_ANOAO